LEAPLRPFWLNRRHAFNMLKSVDSVFFDAACDHSNGDQLMLNAQANFAAVFDNGREAVATGFVNQYGDPDLRHVAGRNWVSGACPSRAPTSRAGAASVFTPCSSTSFSRAPRARPSASA